MFSNQHLESALSESVGAPVRILNSSSISGGSINDAYRLETTEGQFFLKVNSAVRYPGMFDKEAMGLRLLSEHSSFTIPKPIVVQQLGAKQIMVMDWVEQGSPTEDFSEQFGRYLSEMHLCSNPRFGLDHSNYIGSLNQSNEAEQSWEAFYWNQRIAPQIRLATDSGLVTQSMRLGFENFRKELSSIFPTELPALLHGDLWSGNYGVDSDGSPVIFDPAVYYGHREMDLAMMKLFGGFNDSIFETYHAYQPLEPGWEERIPIGQLYPLMVHVNLFGSSYCGQVEQVLSRFR